MAWGKIAVWNAATFFRLLTSASGSLCAEFSQYSGNVSSAQMAIYRAKFAASRVRFTLNAGDGTREMLASEVSVERL
ncbi:hypothetical protein H6F75_19420 [Nodosilinea sp. FACHB-131]|uniref:hypothetical protein n=1 Tax=Cyanophyceae TaxID=3028117 RepID=UPI0016839EA9|nr:hypothetical protein [Nodosilinea sp. FACHB-131]MBD1875656.1 hypothetical protein [Nodosilinea sp. FACHB-131]